MRRELSVTAASPSLVDSLRRTQGSRGSTRLCRITPAHTPSPVHHIADKTFLFNTILLPSSTCSTYPSPSHPSPSPLLLTLLLTLLFTLTLLLPWTPTPSAPSTSGIRRILQPRRPRLRQTSARSVISPIFIPILRISPRITHGSAPTHPSFRRQTIRLLILMMFLRVSSPRLPPIIAPPIAPRIRPRSTSPIAPRLSLPLLRSSPCTTRRMMRTTTPTTAALSCATRPLQRCALRPQSPPSAFTSPRRAARPVTPHRTPTTANDSILSSISLFQIPSITSSSPPCVSPRTKLPMTLPASMVPISQKPHPPVHPILSQARLSRTGSAPVLQRPPILITTLLPIPISTSSILLLPRICQTVQLL